MTGRHLVRLLLPTAAVVAVWALVVGVPALFDSTSADLETASADQALLSADLEAARLLPDGSDAAARLLAAADTAVPATVELAAFVRQVGRVGADEGVTIEQVAPLTVSSSTDPEALLALPVGTSSVTLSIGASGGYEEVMSFAAELGRLDRLVLVDLINLTSDEEDASRVILDLELRIFTTEELVVVPELEDGGLDTIDGVEDVDGAVLTDDGALTAEQTDEAINGTVDAIGAAVDGTTIGGATTGREAGS